MVQRSADGKIGERLREARQSAVMTQDEVADATGIPKATISRIETGKSGQPRPTTLRALAEAVGVHVRWLATGEGSMTGPGDGRRDDE